MNYLLTHRNPLIARYNQQQEPKTYLHLLKQNWKNNTSNVD